MKTAVESLIDEFNEELQVAIAIGNGDKIRIIKHLITIATLHLPKEKEQIGDAWDSAYGGDSFYSGESYYNGTFKQQEQ